jgi:hypothetical protein
MRPLSCCIAILLTLVVLTVACDCGTPGTGTDGGIEGAGGGSGGGQGGGGTSELTCQLNASIPERLSASVIGGAGSVTCSGKASLSLKVCLDYRIDVGSFADWSEGTCRQTRLLLSRCGLISTSVLAFSKGIDPSRRAGPRSTKAEPFSPFPACSGFSRRRVTQSSPEP